MIALLTCLRGTSFLYQGEELGLPHAEVPFEKLKDPEGITFWPRHKGRDGARTPMPWLAAAPFAGFSSAEPWLPIDPRHPPLAVDAQEADPGSVLAFTRGFLAWRKKHPALIRGEIRFLDAPEPVLAFIRGEGEGEGRCSAPSTSATATWTSLCRRTWPSSRSRATASPAALDGGHPPPGPRRPLRPGAATAPPRGLVHRSPAA